MQVVRVEQSTSGGRVSNESLTYLRVRDSRGKLRVIPGDITTGHLVVLKGSRKGVRRESGRFRISWLAG